MKKKIINVLLFLLFLGNLFAQKLTADSRFIGLIQDIESKKTEALSYRQEIIDAMEILMVDAIDKIETEKNKIINTPYRTAELLEDGKTPSKLALNRRDNNVKKATESIIKDSETKLSESKVEAENKISAISDDIKKLCEELKNKIIFSNDTELSITFANYDGSDISWNFYIVLQNGDISVKNTAKLSFETLTGNDPILYMDEDFDKFCDIVDYYTELFSSNNSDCYFELECAAEPFEGTKQVQYRIMFNNLSYIDGEKNFNLTFEEPCVVLSLPSSHLLSDVLEPVPDLKQLIEDELEKNRLEALGFSYVPWIMPAGTDGTIGTSGTYVLYGYWPQSVKSETVTIDDEKTEDINGWTCYKGSDNCYYVKVTTESTDYYGVNFGNGTKIQPDHDYYFKVEPIKWRLISENFHDGDYFLISEVGLTTAIVDNHCDLDAGTYTPRTIDGKNIYPNNYKYSNIRAYLNSLDGTDYGAEDYTDRGFISKAFIPYAINKISNVNVDNSVDSTADYYNKIDKSEKYYCDNTEDKIFLLSENEITNPNYGFQGHHNYIEYYKESPSARCQSDYVKALNPLDDYNYNESAWWWLRTPSAGSQVTMRYVSWSGNSINVEYVTERGTVVPALAISSEWFAVDEVSDLRISITDTKVDLTWKNPDDKNFEKIILSFNGIETEIKEPKGSIVNKSITNLEAGKKYNLRIKTVKNNGVVSSGVSIDFIADKVIEQPIILPVGCTSGSVGNAGRYVLFGNWPQTVKADNVIIDESHSENINGWTCYKGSDGFYYVKEKATCYTNNNKLKFSNGDDISRNQFYYYKLEPIKWRVLSDDYQNGNLLVAENILDIACFYHTTYMRDYSSIYPSDYSKSDIRAYLNGLSGDSYDEIEDFEGKGFINKAFSSKAIENINTVKVRNDEHSSMDNEYNFRVPYELISDDTEDKIFLLSISDITCVAYGFEPGSEFGYYGSSSTRVRNCTDYAFAKSEFEKDSINGESASWWLRTPSEYGNGRSICVSSEDGRLTSSDYYTNSQLGVVPALSISF